MIICTFDGNMGLSSIIPLRLNIQNHVGSNLFIIATLSQAHLTHWMRAIFQI